MSTTLEVPPRRKHSLLLCSPYACAPFSDCVIPHCSLYLGEGHVSHSNTKSCSKVVLMLPSHLPRLASSLCSSVLRSHGCHQPLSELLVSPRLHGSPDPLCPLPRAPLSSFMHSGLLCAWQQSSHANLCLLDLSPKS